MVTTLSIYKTFDQQNKISYNLFSNIIKEYNKIIIDKIIYGEVLEMGFSLGSLLAIEQDRKVHSIKWKESLERKQQLIKEGKLPLEKYKDENHNIIGDNGGIEWMIYNLKDTIIRFFWSRGRVRINNESNEYYFPLKRIRHYHFKIVRKNYKTLNRVAEENKLKYSKLI